jgi:hypothetical protein
MVIIRAKTLDDRIDLFIKIADEDGMGIIIYNIGNGLLSEDEIMNLSKICLSKYISVDTPEGE